MSTKPLPVPPELVAIVGPLVGTLRQVRAENGYTWTAAEARNAATALVWEGMERRQDPQLRQPSYASYRRAWGDGGILAAAFDQLWAEADRAN